MMNFSAEPARKSEKEKLFDELNAQYTEKFGKPYFFAIGIGFSTWDETIEDIRKRIETGEPQPEPDYEPGNDY